MADPHFEDSSGPDAAETILTRLLQAAAALAQREWSDMHDGTVDSIGFHVRSTWRWSPAAVVGVVRLVDLCVVLATGLLAFYARFGTWAVPGEELLVIALTVTVVANLFHLRGLYGFHRFHRGLSQCRRVAIGWGLSLLTVMSIGYATKDLETFSRLWMGFWFVGGLVGLCSLRLACAAVLRGARAQGALARHIAIITPAGRPDVAERLRRHFLRDPSARIVASVEEPLDADDAAAFGTAQRGVAAAGLVRIARTTRIDQVVAALPLSDRRALEERLAPVSDLAVELLVLPPDLDESLADKPIGNLGGLPAVVLGRPPLSDWDVVQKRIEDLVLGSLVLLVAAPVMAIIALAIKLESRGPVLFRQDRNGFGNGRFTVYKFRTMKHRPEGEADVRQATQRDPRVTRIGWLLRRTSLDELPQIFNVLKGEMSLVGPRPHAVAHNDQFHHRIERYMARHRVKPGITGWAQVKGHRGETDTLDKMRRRVECDIAYADNWSLLFDLKILVLTVFCFTGKNAY